MLENSTPVEKTNEFSCQVRSGWQPHAAKRFPFNTNSSLAAVFALAAKVHTDQWARGFKLRGSASRSKVIQIKEKIMAVRKASKRPKSKKLAKANKMQDVKNLAIYMKYGQ